MSTLVQEATTKRVQICKSEGYTGTLAVKESILTRLSHEIREEMRRSAYKGCCHVMASVLLDSTVDMESFARSTGDIWDVKMCLSIELKLEAVTSPPRRAAH